jgi:predicted PurR-regulated permease PerM
VFVVGVCETNAPHAQAATVGPVNDDSTDREQPHRHGTKRHILDLPLTSMAKATAVVVATFFIVNSAWHAFNRLGGLLLLCFISLFMSFALEPWVAALAKRGWKRGAATAALIGSGVVLAAGFLTAMGALLFDQARQLIDNSGSYTDRLRELAGEAGIRLNAERLDSISKTVSDLASSGVSAAGKGAASTIGTGLFIMFVTFYLTAEGPKLRRFICSFLRPEQQGHVLRVWEAAIETTGGYILTRVIQAAVGAGLCAVAFTWLGLPNALALAAWAGVISQAVPVVGTYLAGALPVLVAFVNDPWDAVWVLVFVIVWQQLENLVILPRLSRKYMDLHPVVGFLSVAAGAVLAGVPGTLLALPIAATVQSVASAYLTEKRRHDVVDTPLT